VTAEARPGFLDAVRALGSALNETRLPWQVIGGVAVIARGVARFTADVDATLWAPTHSRMGGAS
jgi:hypothetical protein